MDPDECFVRLGTVAIGRLGLSVGALPAVVPVPFDLDGDEVLFHTVAGSALDDASAGAVVAFQADDFRPDGTGWSVLLQGISAPVGGPGPWPAGLRARVLPLTEDAGPPRLLRLRPATVSGLTWT
jgi:nitroimidazol reductase NimA-like FMN-containing flavoprotein (pyridoxamine 5'-phosphate oxidase superfamily)